MPGGDEQLPGVRQHNVERADDPLGQTYLAKYLSACRTNGAPPWGPDRRLGSWFMPQNFLFPQRDQPLLMPVDMREWLPEDDLVYVVPGAVAALDLGGFRRQYRADGHGRAAFDPEMMAALLLYAYCQGERSSRVIEKRCMRDVGYRVICGGLRPDHATIARFRARHEQALGPRIMSTVRSGTHSMRRHAAGTSRRTLCCWRRHRGLPRKRQSRTRSGNPADSFGGEPTAQWCPVGCGPGTWATAGRSARAQMGTCRPRNRDDADPPEPATPEVRARVR